MKKNKSKIILLVIVSIVSLFSIISYNSKKYSNSININDSKIKNNNMLSMMLETSAGSGEYQETTSSSWPTEGYVFNENISKCERGSKLTWDDSKKAVIMSGNEGDKCYVYFDVYVPPSIADYCNNGDNLASCIKTFGNQGSEISNIYIHNASLTNGAKDNSYRYAGPSDTTNNFVCFGYDSQDGTCPSDNLYRIIGVFGDEVKLIKYDYAKSTLLGTDGDYSQTYQAAGYGGTNKGQNTQAEIGGYYWNRKGANTWSESRLNTVNLNKNYINKIDENGTKWSDKISDHEWKVGGNTYNNIAGQTAPNAYQNEINSPATNKTVNAKVGLMYVSDYGYAASSSSWSTALNSYNNANVTANNWMYMGLYEWTLAPQTDDSSCASRVTDVGNVRSNYVHSYTYGVRPVLYLKSTINYAGGSGDAAKPILVK